MPTERDVIEFIIVPPFAKRVAVVAAKERLESYLENRFRGYSFRVGSFAPLGDEEEFCVLPLMKFVGDDGRSYMCTSPKKWFLQEISNACREFDFRGTRHFAA
ncbi:hypothetical protein EVB88_060 [Rhizobium phage RHph_N28_2]|nr:hypothetical protein EVB88_060 [Rhizobium phage RHph_N28_2]